MPELPEAETIVEGLRGPLTGRSISSVDVLREDLLEVPARAFSRSLRRGVLRAVSRRGKNVVLRITGAGGGPVRFVVVNLGMSGRLLHRLPGSEVPPPSHPGVSFELDDGSRLVYHDIRRFGRLRLLTDRAYHSWSDTLGPEPLSRRFRSPELLRSLTASRAPVRSWLLDQRKIAGVGNIYANEALARARIHPMRAANGLTEGEGRRLYRSIRRVLREAVAARGTTLRDYRTAQGWKGSYADELRVYGKEGTPCRRCGHRIERLVFGGRSAFLCPVCQPPEKSPR